MLAMPLAPWQVWQPRARACPAAASPAARALSMQKVAAPISAAAQTALLVATRLLPVIGDAVQRTVEIVGYQHRTITHLRDIDRTAEIFAILVKPAFSE